MDIQKLLLTLGPQLERIKSDLIAVASTGTFLQRLGLIYDAVLQVMLLAEQIQGAIGADKKAFVVAAVLRLYDEFNAYLPGHFIWGPFLDGGIKLALAAIVEQVYSRLFANFQLQAKAPALS